MHPRAVATAPRSPLIRLLVPGLCLGLVAAACGRTSDVQAIVPPDETRAPAVVFSPPGLAEVGEALTRAAAQRSVADAIDAFHDFRFTDVLARSGITFRHQAVEDAGRRYRSTHYVQGSGVAAADVDGDGLADLYFVNQVGGSRLFRNLGGGRFDDVTLAWGARVGGVGVGAYFADIDNDGDPDLYVTTVRGGNVLFENDGNGRFADITARAGVGVVGHSAGAVFFDYDGDGRLDLFVAGPGRYTTEDAAGDGYRYFIGTEEPAEAEGHPAPGRPGLLFRNEGDNRFTEQSAIVGLDRAGPSGDAIPLDANGDGWTDLYVLDPHGADTYFENVRGTAFVARQPEGLARTPWGATGGARLDADADGRLDLLVTDFFSDQRQGAAPAQERERWAQIPGIPAREDLVFGNALLLARDHGRFEDATGRFSVEHYQPWGPSVGDLNADGYEDIFLPSGAGYPERYVVNGLKLNVRGDHFADAEFLLGVEPRRDGRTAVPWFELDASGPDRAHPAASGQQGPVTVWGARSSRSAVLVDLENDGDLDIVTNDFHAEPAVLESNLTERTLVRFLKIRLVGTRSNRDGLGAVVRVTAGGRTRTRAHDGRSGHLAQSTLPLYVGLGQASAVDRVEVLWPSGQRQVVTSPLVNATLVITEQP